MLTWITLFQLCFIPVQVAVIVFGVYVLWKYRK